MPSARSSLSAPPVRRLTVGPEAFPYVDLGAGPPLLFLHGALGDLRTWLPHCAALSGRHRCVAFTQRYFGAGPWRPDGPPFGVATHASDLIAFADALGAGPLDLVAWSYAGHVALHAALNRPDLFRRLLVYEPGVPTYVTDAGERAAFARDAEAMFGPVFQAVRAGDLAAAVRHLVDASGGDGYFDRQAAPRRAVQMENRHTMPLLLDQPAPPAIGCGDLAALQVPTAIVWGERSRPVFSVPSRAAARCIGRGWHRTVPGAGHLWPEEDPDGFAGLLTAWLDRDPG